MRLWRAAVGAARAGADLAPRRRDWPRGMWAPPPPTLAPWRVLAPLAAVDLSRVASTSARPQHPARGFKRQSAIQRALLGARDVRSILAVVRAKADGDNGLGAMSFVHVATSLNRMGKVAWRVHPGARDSERNLGDDPDFLALLRRAREFTYTGSKMSQAWANSVHALAKLRELRRLRVEPGDEVWDTWLDLIRRLPDLEGKLLSKHVTSVWWAHAVVGVVPDDATRAALGRELERLADDFEPRNVSNAVWAIATLGIQPTREEWTILNDIIARTYDESPDLPPERRTIVPQNVSNTLWAFAKIGRAPEEDARVALDAAVRRHARAMNSQEIANSVYALGVLGHSPGAAAEAALAGAARVALRVASRDGESTPSRITPQSLSNMLYGLAAMGTRLNAQTWAAADAAVEKLAPRMCMQDVCIILWAHGTARRPPARGSFLALERRYATLASRPETVEKQNHSVVLWAYGKMNTMPSDDMWDALELVARRKTVDYERHDVFMALWGYAALGRYPRGRDVTEQLEAAALRAVDDFLPDEIANVLWSYALLRAVRGVPLPAFYARLWARMTKMPASAFQTDEVIRVGYHAHLVHARLLRDEDPVPDLEPSFERRGKELWFAQTTRVSVSAMQLEIGEALKRLGVAHVVEPPPFPGEFFGMDIHLPDYDVALECEGPHHYYAGVRGVAKECLRLRDPNAPIAPGQPGTVRNARTQLRDAFHARERAGGLVSLPWWEVHRASKTGDLDEWLARELEKQAGVVVDRVAARERTRARTAEASDGSSVPEVGRRWMESLPPARRAALERVVAAAGNDADAWRAVVASAESDGTKKRAALREEVLARAAAEVNGRG